MINDPKDPRTENDAVHPRFAQPLAPEEVEDCIRNRYYYCKSCKIPFSADVAGLRYHFNGEIADHKPYASCFYCRGSVYCYFFKDQFKVYHECRKCT